MKRLPGFQRTAAGREWGLWKRLPAIWALGTAVPLVALTVLWWMAPESPTAAQERGLLLLTYQLIGVVVLHWTLVLTVAIGCIVVMIMKGPAFVADAYPPPEREHAGTDRNA